MRWYMYGNACMYMAEPLKKNGHLGKPDDQVAPRTVRYCHVSLYLMLII